MRCALLGTIALLALTVPVQAQKTKPAAQCTMVHGALLTSEKPGTWEPIAAKSDIPADRLVVALFHADVLSPDGAVEAKLLADVGHRGPFASLESRVRFHTPKDADFDLTLDRGIVVLLNKKKTGSAKVAVRVADEVFEVTLHDAKSRVGIEVHGRHMPGPPRLKKGESDIPVVTMLLFALEGEAVVSNGKHATRLHAPPGACLYMWDSISHSIDVQRFETTPDFAKPFSDKEKAVFMDCCKAAHPLAEKGADRPKILAKAVASADAMERKTAVVCMGAIDDTAGLLAAIGDKNADVRKMAVLVARHWVGRAPGQEGRWHDLLVKEGYTPGQAKNMLYLLNGIETDKLRQPATFDVLIHGLNHAKTPMRELAHWHLIRLVAGGKDIAYDAAAPEAQRLQSIEAWRRLVPEGELPTPPKKSEK
jgi:hypothetical protein